ncbi:Mitochondrial transcription termination factor family protein [Forsythia ovata]|uniref:Mitochondrial transcription termination factor family protein n=1 Tax=Forsythia ovata TaxID=205694 RepID=A0ABD1X3Z9_9LAMI
MHCLGLATNFSHPVFPKKFPIRLSSETSVRKISEKKLERVKTLFRNYGFDETHILHIATAQPTLFLNDLQNILLPKLDFLQSIGVPITGIPKIIVRNPSLLGRSLEKQILPCYNFLKSLPLSRKEVVMMVSRNSRILGTNVEKIANNVELMQQVGVPSSSISYLISRFPGSVQRDNEKFKKCLDEVIRMEFNPLRLKFVQAVRVVCETPKPTWDYKVEVFKRFGLSDDEVMSAFRLCPGCMNVSEEKMLSVMDFIINKMKWEPAVVIRSPVVLLFNLENRTIPRCNVITLLMQKGFLKENYSLASFLQPSEEKFLNKFVYNYKDVLPQLADVYSQRMVL